MAECYIEKESDLIDGIENGHAVRREHSIELWDEEFDTRLGSMPVDSTVSAINGAIRMYNRGFKDGEQYGKRCQQEIMRRALGLDS
jgi:hypothetical protein